MKQGAVKENTLGLPLVMSGGFALTYAVTTPRRKCAVRCFHREIPSIEQKYHAISKKLRSLKNGYFVDFDFQTSGISVRQGVYPIVRMDWVEGGTLGIWLDQRFNDPRALERARAEFRSIARFLEREGIGHGDIQNGNVMVTDGTIKLIDYDGMFVPGMSPGNGSETGHRHFQHPDRKVSDYGPKMDRFSFIALDLSLQSVIEDASLYQKFREGGETIIFKANDFADPQSSEIFRRLLAMPKLKQQARNFAAICDAPLAAVPPLDDFLAGRSIPAAKMPIKTSPSPAAGPHAAAYIPAYPVVDALNFPAALGRVGDRVELIGRIVEVKPGARKRGKGRVKRYVFINFGSWRGNIVKISIWSEGLAKLKEQPSNAWIGRWVSVTGLIDVPYENKRHGYKHLSITVEEDGQIQQLEEAEAGFRLASIAKTPHRKRGLPEGAPAFAAPRVARAIWRAFFPLKGKRASGTPRVAPPAAAATAKNLPLRNRDIVSKFKQDGSRAQPVPALRTAAAAKRGAARSSGFFDRMRRWVWVGGLGIGLVLFLYALIVGAR
ncbi:MAG: serine/threonine protein kinase [Xanthobacteraceae bacterium]